MEALGAPPRPRRYHPFFTSGAGTEGARELGPHLRFVSAPVASGCTWLVTVGGEVPLGAPPDHRPPGAIVARWEKVATARPSGQPTAPAAAQPGPAQPSAGASAGTSTSAPPAAFPGLRQGRVTNSRPRTHPPRPGPGKGKVQLTGAPPPGGAGTLFVPWPSPAPHTPLAQLNSTPSFPLPPHLLLLPSSPSSTTTTQKIRRDAGNGPLADSNTGSPRLDSSPPLRARAVGALAVSLYPPHTVGRQFPPRPPHSGAVSLPAYFASACRAAALACTHGSIAHALSTTTTRTAPFDTISFVRPSDAPSTAALAPTPPAPAPTLPSTPVRPIHPPRLCHPSILLQHWQHRAWLQVCLAGRPARGSSRNSIWTGRAWQKTAFATTVLSTITPRTSKQLQPDSPRDHRHLPRTTISRAGAPSRARDPPWPQLSPSHPFTRLAAPRVTALKDRRRRRLLPGRVPTRMTLAMPRPTLSTATRHRPRASSLLHRPICRRCRRIQPTRARRPTPRTNEAATTMTDGPRRASIPTLTRRSSTRQRATTIVGPLESCPPTAIPDHRRDRTRSMRRSQAAPLAWRRLLRDSGPRSPADTAARERFVGATPSVRFSTQAGSSAADQNF